MTLTPLHVTVLTQALEAEQPSRIEGASQMLCSATYKL